MNIPPSKCRYCLRHIRKTKNNASLTFHIKCAREYLEFMQQCTLTKLWDAYREEDQHLENN